MVDQGKFFASYRSVKPFLINDQAADGRERVQSPKERAAFDDATSCILCGACFSACPVFETNTKYVGPGSRLVSAARFIFDSRDKGLAQRMSVLDDPNGAAACENHFDCTRVCPREIKVTKNINAIKREIDKFKGKKEGPPSPRPVPRGVPAGAGAPRRGSRRSSTVGPVPRSFPPWRAG